MFNVSGTEVAFLLILGLVVLGPEKLPGVIRRVGAVYREIKNISDSFKETVSSAVEEPLRELRGTADAAREAISNITTAEIPDIPPTEKDDSTPL